jgi:hypothetical protein
MCSSSNAAARRDWRAGADSRRGSAEPRAFPHCR